jgi:hypothetical protein
MSCVSINTDNLELSAFNQVHDRRVSSFSKSVVPSLSIAAQPPQRSLPRRFFPMFDRSLKTQIQISILVKLEILFERTGPASIELPEIGPGWSGRENSVGFVTVQFKLLC